MKKDHPTSKQKLNEKQPNSPTLAPGIDNDEELDEEATPEEKKKGEFTETTRLSYDEIEPD